MLWLGTTLQNRFCGRCRATDLGEHDYGFNDNRLFAIPSLFGKW